MQTNNNNTSNTSTNIFEDTFAANEQNFIEVILDVLKKVKEEDDLEEGDLEEGEEEDELAKLNESFSRMLEADAAEAAVLEEQHKFNVCITCGNKSESHTIFCKSECESEFLNKEKREKIEDKEDKEEEEEEKLMLLEDLEFEDFAEDLAKDLAEDLAAEEHYEYITSCLYCLDKIEENAGFCNSYCYKKYQSHHSVISSEYRKF